MTGCKSWVCLLPLKKCLVSLERFQDKDRLEELRNGVDSTNEVEPEKLVSNPNLFFTSEWADLKKL